MWSIFSCAFWSFVYLLLRNVYCPYFVVVNLFLAALGLRCWARAFSSCGKWGLLFVAVHSLLTVVASLVAGHGL